MGESLSSDRVRKDELQEKQRKADRKMALRLKDKGLSNAAIAIKMQKPTSTVRNLLK